MIGKNIRRLRRIQDITQVDLAARAELSRQQLSAIECGKFEPRISTAQRIAAALGVTIDDLLIVTQKSTAMCTKCGTQYEQKGNVVYPNCTCRAPIIYEVDMSVLK